MRRASAIDGNHNRIADALRKVGCWVWSTAALGNGFPDLLVLFRGTHSLLEVKDGSLPPSARKLTPKEEAFWASYPGPKHVVENVPDAFRAIGLKEWPGKALGGLFDGARQISAIAGSVLVNSSPASEQKPPALPPIRRKRGNGKAALP